MNLLPFVSEDVCIPEAQLRKSEDLKICLADLARLQVNCPSGRDLGRVRQQLKEVYIRDDLPELPSILAPDLFVQIERFNGDVHKTAFGNCYRRSCWEEHWLPIDILLIEGNWI